MLKLNSFIRFVFLIFPFKRTFLIVLGPISGLCNEWLKIMNIISKEIFCYIDFMIEGWTNLGKILSGIEDRISF